MKKLKFIWSIVTIFLFVILMVMGLSWISQFRNQQQVSLSKHRAEYNHFRYARDYNLHVAPQKQLTEEVQSILKKANFEGHVYVVEGSQVRINEDVGQKNHDKQYLNPSIDRLLLVSAMAKLIENGEVDVNSSLSKYFPRLKYAKKVTISQLLNNAAGIMKISKSDLSTATSSSAMQKQIVDQVEISPKLIGRIEQSVGNDALIGSIIEQASKNSLAHELAGQVVNPLQLYSTKRVDRADTVQKLASNYQGKKNESKSEKLANILGKYGYYPFSYTSGDMYFIVKSVLQGQIANQSTINGLLALDTSQQNLGFTRYDQSTYVANTHVVGTQTVIMVAEGGSQCVILQTNKKNKKVNLQNLSATLYKTVSTDLNRFPNYAL